MGGWQVVVVVVVVVVVCVCVCVTRPSGGSQRGAAGRRPGVPSHTQARNVSFFLCFFLAFFLFCIFRSTHVGAVNGDQAGDQGHQLVLVQPAKGAVDQQLGGQQLVCRRKAAVESMAGGAEPA